MHSHVLSRVSFASLAPVFRNDPTFKYTGSDEGRKRLVMQLRGQPIIPPRGVRPISAYASTHDCFKIDVLLKDFLAYCKMEPIESYLNVYLTGKDDFAWCIYIANERLGRSGYMTIVALHFDGADKEACFAVFRAFLQMKPLSIKFVYVLHEQYSLCYDTRLTPTGKVVVARNTPPLLEFYKDPRIRYAQM